MLAPVRQCLDNDEIPQALAAMCMNEVPHANQYVNTDSTAHMTSTTGNLLSTIPFSREEKIFTDDGAGISISHT